MQGYSIRSMKESEIKNIYKHIEQDFSRGEYAPYAVLHDQLQQGLQEGMILYNEEKDLAYSVCTVHSNGYVLVSLLAVFPEYRGQGIGSAFMEKLHEIYKQKKGIILEVERPDLSKTPAEHDLRIKRINFYEKAGYFLVPGIDYIIWDVPMYLMDLPLTASRETITENIGEIMHQIYLKLMGERFIHKMELKTVD